MDGGSGGSLATPTAVTASGTVRPICVTTLVASAVTAPANAVPVLPASDASAAEPPIMVSAPTTALTTSASTLACVTVLPDRSAWPTAAARATACCLCVETVTRAALAAFSLSALDAAVKSASGDTARPSCAFT